MFLRYVSRVSAIIFINIFFVLGITQLSAQRIKSPMMKMQKNVVTTAIAVLNPTAGNNVKGVVRFIEVKDGIKVVADIEGLAPGKHGFHIHQYGDCSSSDGKSAGGHFNPTDMPHGSPDSPKHHIGDLGNIEADQNGKAHLERVYSFLRLNGPLSIIGRGVIIHSGEDDLKSQPIGAAGKRVVCGVIGIAKATEEMGK